VSTYRLDPDGPHSDDYTRHVAQALAESVRVLNHATRHRNGVTEPATVNAVLSSLRDGLARMDQMLQQLDTRLVRFAQSGRLADTSGDPFATVNSTLRQIVGLRADAAVMAERLDRAHNASSGLYLRDQDGE
jgi:hypothetical protein